jgi:hypothetical protein
MRFEKETIVILLLLAAVLGPMWTFALLSTTTETPVTLSQEKGKIAPSEQVFPAPVEVNEYVAGVITWVAVFAVVAMIFYTHQFVRSVGQSGDPVDATEQSSGAVAADGGGRSVDLSEILPSYLLTDDRWLANYWPARFSTPGMIGIAAMSWSAVVFAVLFVMEALSWARTQLLGIYGGMMFLSLGVLVAVYAIWFLPSMHIVEDRDHAKKIGQGDGED